MISNSEKIQYYLNNGRTVTVRRSGTNQLMIALKYAMVDNGILLETREDIILCKWQDEKGIEHEEGINIVELELA